MSPLSIEIVGERQTCDEDRKTMREEEEEKGKIVEKHKRRNVKGGTGAKVVAAVYTKMHGERVAFWRETLLLLPHLSGIFLLLDQIDDESRDTHDSRRSPLLENEAASQMERRTEGDPSLAKLTQSRRCDRGLNICL